MAMSRARAHGDVVVVLVGQGGEVERLLEDGCLRLAVRPGLLVYQRQKRRRRVTLRLRDTRLFRKLATALERNGWRWLDTASNTS